MRYLTYDPPLKHLAHKVEFEKTSPLQYSCYYKTNPTKKKKIGVITFCPHELQRFGTFSP
jgi:hypothetical protein